MTLVGILEGLTSSIGQELNRLGGLRSTRVQAGHAVTAGDTTWRVETTLGWESAGYFYSNGQLYQYTGINTFPTYGEFTGVEYYDDVADPVTNLPIYLPGAVEDLEVLTEIVDYTRIYSAVDKMRRTFLVDTALGADLDTLARNIGVFRQPELITSDNIFREIVKAVAYSPRGTMYVIELYLDALFGVGNYVVFEDMTNSGYPTTMGPTYASTQLNGPLSVNNPAQIFVTNQLSADEQSAGSAFLEGPVLGEIDSGAGPGATTADIKFAAYYPYNHTPVIQGCKMMDEGGLRVVVDPVRSPPFEATAVATVVGAEILVTFTTTGTADVVDYVRRGDLMALTLTGADDYSRVNGPSQGRIVGTVSDFDPGAGPNGTVTLGIDNNGAGNSIINPHPESSSLPGFFEWLRTSGITSFNIPSGGWMFLREKTLCSYQSFTGGSYLPSDDEATEGVPANATVPNPGADHPRRAWTWVSTQAETAPLVGNGGGIFPSDYGTQITAFGSLAVTTDYASYRQEARVLPDSYASFEASLSLGGTFETGAVDQLYMEIVDGDTFNNVPGKHVRIGFDATGAAPGDEVRVGFSDASGSFISGATIYKAELVSHPSTYTPEHVFRIVKDGQRWAHFYVDDVLIDSIDYASLTTAAVVDQHRTIGMFGTNATSLSWAPAMRVGWLNWSSRNPTDLTNIRIRDASAILGTTQVEDDNAEQLLASVPVGSRVNITAAGQSLDDYPGNAIGEFEVSSVVSANSIELTGFRRAGNAIVVPQTELILGVPTVVHNKVRIGATSRDVPGIQETDEPYAFTFPNDLGKKIRIYTGASYEERTITKILDPVSGDSIGPTFGVDESVIPNTLTTLARESLPTISSNYCQVDSDFSTAYDNAEWSIEPTFPGTASTGASVQFISASSQSLHDAVGNAGPLAVADSAFTVALWFNTTSAAAQVLGWYEAADAAMLPVTDLNISMNAGLVGATLFDGTGTSQSVGGVNTYDDGVWHLVVVTWDIGSGTLTVDIDPGDPGGETITTPCASRRGSLHVPPIMNPALGASFGGTILANFFDGYIDEVSHWFVALDATEREELFANRHAIDLATHSQSAFLKAWWRMGEAPGDSTDSADPTARIYDVGPGSLNIDLTPTNMVTANISTVIFVPQLGDTGIVFDVIQQSSYTGSAGTLLSTLTMPFGAASKVGAYHKPAAYVGNGEPRMQLLRTNIPSAQVLDPDRDNTVQTTPPAYDYYPFYLTGSEIGTALNILQKVLTAAGVHVNLRGFYVDASGPHIV